MHKSSGGMSISKSHWQIELAKQMKRSGITFQHINFELDYYMRFELCHFNMKISGMRSRCSIRSIAGYDYFDPDSDIKFEIISNHGVYVVNLTTNEVDTSRGHKLVRWEKDRMMHRTKQAIKNCKALQ
jgi:hypothetical protein